MRSRRTLLVVLVVVDVVLVVLLVVLAINRGNGGGRGSDNPSGAVAGSGGSAQPSGGATSSSDVTAFALPSGNIACTMSVDGVTCTIASYTYPAPVVAGCTEVTGHRIVLNADGVAFACVSGPPPAVAGADVPVLEYGQAANVGEYTCTSATDGVTCVDGAGKGFQLARASWKEIG